MFPVGIHRLGLRSFAMLAAGPLANLATVAAIVALPFEKGAFTSSRAFWSLFLGTIFEEAQALIGTRVDLSGRELSMRLLQRWRDELAS